jgi:hypothetical protein
MTRRTKIRVHTLRFWRLAWVTGTLFVSTQIPISGAEPSGQVASHGLERDAVNADGTGEGAGYFTFIQGVAGSLFSGLPSEATAFFTFRTELRALFPHGFTIAFNTNPTPINNSFPLIFCLGFTSFAIGSDAGQN